MFFTRKTTGETAPRRNRLIRNTIGAQWCYAAHHAAPGPAFRVSDRLHEERSVTVAAHEIAATVAGWPAELGAHSPLVDQLASAVHKGDWVTAHAIAEHLSVDVTSAR